MVPSSPPASLLASTLSALVLLACRDESSTLSVEFQRPVVALSAETDGRVHIEGTFDLSARLAPWSESEETSIWLDKLDVTTAMDPLRPLAAEVHVPDGASLFPLSFDRIQGGKVKVPFTAKSLTAPGDELAWLCSIGEPMELQGAVYDAAVGLVQGFYDSAIPGVTSNGEIVFSRKNPADKPLAPRFVKSLPQLASGFVPLLDVKHAWGGIVLGGAFLETLNLGGKIVAANDGDALLVRYDAEGNLVWGGGFGGPGEDGITSLVQAQGGDLFVGGTFAQSMDLGSGALVNPDPDAGRGFFVARMSESGAAVWSFGFVEQKIPLGLGTCTPARLRVAPRVDGSVSLVKTIHSTVDLGAGPLAPSPLVQGCSGDLLVAAVDAAGKLLHAQRFGDEYDQQVTDVAVDAAGNTWIVGFTAGLLDLGQGLAPIVGPMSGPGLTGEGRLFVAAFDPQGLPILTRDLGAIQWRLGHQVRLAARPAGGVVVAGPFTGRLELGAAIVESTGPGEDGFVVALDAAGVPLWAQRFDHSVAIVVDGFNLGDVAVAEDGRVIVVGRATSLVRFGGGQLMGGGFPSFGAIVAGSLFSVVLDPAGAPLGARILACSSGISALDVVGDEAALVSAVLGYAEGEEGHLPRGEGALWMGRLSLAGP